MKPFYYPSLETLDVLQTRQWISAYSGGKDSTALITMIEWLRRSDLIDCPKPRLVQSDTEVEYPFLEAISKRMTDRLTECGWVCDIVRPPIEKKLYNSIFGRGLPPVHPSHKKRMRWCTNATKVQPMGRFSRTIGPDVIILTGVRWGESDNRDGKLLASGCSAGGECGLPSPGEGRYGPIITWKTCQVIDWLQGLVVREVRDKIKDLLPIMKELLDVYNVRFGRKGLGFSDPEVFTLRFGCIGCPAVHKDKVIEANVNNNPTWKALRRLYAIWEEIRSPRNRVIKIVKGKNRVGPIKMEVRKRLFDKVLAIQAKAGITIVTEKDEAFIRQCWANNVYPKGWSAEDERL